MDRDERDALLESWHGPTCPIENVRTMAPVDSGPAGLRWRCHQCGVVVVMPRAPLARAIKLYRSGGSGSRAMPAYDDRPGGNAFPGWLDPMTGRDKDR